MGRENSAPLDAPQSCNRKNHTEDRKMKSDHITPSLSIPFHADVLPVHKKKKTNMSEGGKKIRQPTDAMVS